MSYPRTFLNIGDLFVCGPDNIIITNLGSCVALGLVWKRKGLFSLCHCLLPEPIHDTVKLSNHGPAKYVTLAVPLMLKEMGVPRRQYRDLEAHVFGGAQQYKVMEVERNVGQLNINALLQALAFYQIPIVETDVGGQVCRQVHLNTTTGTFDVKKPEQSGGQVWKAN